MDKCFNCYGSNYETYTANHPCDCGLYHTICFGCGEAVDGCTYSREHVIKLNKRIKDLEAECLRLRKERDDIELDTMAKYASEMD